MINKSIESETEPYCIRFSNYRPIFVLPFLPLVTKVLHGTLDLVASWLILSVPCITRKLHGVVR